VRQACHIVISGLRPCCSDFLELSHPLWIWFQRP
jgi:hypothetical protein